MKEWEYETRHCVGWKVQVRRELRKADVEQALLLLSAQLQTICRVVPKRARLKLQEVTLWLSPEYPNTPPRAEYHPGTAWLAEHGRNPAMAQGVEFTNLRIFAADTRRMPLFALHELAHAYHDRVLGSQEPHLLAAYETAKKSGSYDRVERRDSEGRTRLDRAYALTNVQEYFAEGTEAFFGRNDFFPYDRAQLQKHDPALYALLATLWSQ